jgi:hypothetical protein
MASVERDHFIARLFTVVLVLAAGYFGLGATLLRAEIAWSAFFGVRAPADMTLGVLSIALAAAPWLAGGLTWWVMGRGDKRRTITGMLGRPGTRTWKLRWATLATSVVGLVVVIGSIRLI